MKTLFLRLLALCICLTSTTALMAQDPRTPISSLPYTISMPGSYYLTANLTGSGQGITISADNVTLDLNGFALIGGGSGQAGINVSGAHKNITIRNGTVRGWANGGVNAANATNSMVQGLRISNNTAMSAFLNAGGLSIGAGSTVKDCVVTQNTNCHGIAAGRACLVTGCVVSGNSAAGIRATDNCYI
ncbi:MAG TPA: right-handed parallel beta-helix repeat-containing protein, partial [Chthoniobacterales bacterium]